MPTSTLSFDSGESSLSVRRFSVSEGVSACFTASVWARSPDTSIDIESIVGKAASLRLESGFAFAALGGARQWTGVCSYMEQTRVEGAGLSTYFLRIVPRLWLLGQKRDHRIFQHLTIPDIVDRILAEWAVEPTWRLDRGDYPRLEYRVQHGESDYDFVTRLLEEAGISFTFPDDDAAGTRLTLGDKLQANPLRAAPPIKYVDNPNEASEKEFVTRVRLSHEVRPGAHAIRDHDFRKPGYALFGKAPKAAPPEDVLEQYHYAPGAFLVEKVRSGDLEDRAHPHHDEKVGTDRAERALLGERTGKRGIEFQANVLDLWPGVVFAIQGHPHPEIDEQRFLVTALTIDGEVGGEWSARGQAVLAADIHRPALVTPRPRLRCVESATVVGPADLDIYADEFGRVKVQFPWDREGRSDDESSCWMRVSQGWAGSAYGMMHVPRIGQEVLVAFLDGNPDQPIVVGRVYNQKNPVPYPLPDDKTKSTWKSDTSPGSGGFNELMFEDKKGDELVSAQAERNQRQLIKNDETITVGHDRDKQVVANEMDTTGRDRFEVTGEDRSQTVGKSRATVIGGNRERLIKGTETERTEGDHLLLTEKDRHALVKGEKRELVGNISHLHVKGNRNETIGGTLSLRTSSLQVKVEKSHALASGDETHLAGKVVVGEGAADVTVAGPGGFLRIDAAGVTIKGTLVKINVGGSAGSGSGAHPAPPAEPLESKPESKTPVVRDPPDPKKKPAPPAGWTPAELKANIDTCDGGTGIYAKAKAANGGKDPVVKKGTASTGGQVDLSTGEITLDPGQDKCTATQVQIQELTNLSHKADFEKATKEAAAGDLSREGFIKAYEKIEYDGVQNVIKAFDSCKDKWGCKTCEKEWARKYKTFDDYYDKALSNDHKEYYGKFWDTNYKAAYKAKHP